MSRRDDGTDCSTIPLRQRGRPVDAGRDDTRRYMRANMVANGSIRSRSAAALGDVGANLDDEEVRARARLEVEALEPAPPYTWRMPVIRIAENTEERRERVRQLRELPVMTVEEAAYVLGISRASAYKAVGEGQIKVKTYGRRMLVLTRPLFAELGYEL